VTRRRAKTAVSTEEKPVETAEVAAEAKPEEKPTKPTRKRSKKAETAEAATDEVEASALTEKEKKDATT